MAYVATGHPDIMIGDVTFIPFRAALDLYARAAWAEEKFGENK